VGKPAVRNKRILRLFKNRVLLLMMVPGIIVMFLNSYLPLFGVSIAFKSIDYELGIFRSPFVGLKNFGFMFVSNDIWNAVKNTLLYNIIFIVTGMIASVFIAVIMTELRNRFAAKFYQTVTIMPSFLSIIIVASIVGALVAERTGYINTFLRDSGRDPVLWLSTPNYWYIILPVVNLWKGAAMGSILYFATICGISPELYEAAYMDGGGKFAQFWYITLPMLRAIIGIQMILSIGNIFRADIGMFQQVTQDAKLLLPATDVIDTFVYRSLINMQNVGMSSAASFIQSSVGCILLVSVNMIVRRVDPDSSLF
jgi:putative aldouronate transport system permease protein